MTYTDTLDRLATGTQEQVIAAYGSWQAGKITLDEFLAVATAFLAAAGNKATALADTALAAFLTAITQQAVPVLGAIPVDTDHRPALVALVDAGESADRFGTLARAVALAAAQDAYQAAMVTREIPAWTRVLNSGACELCVDLAGPVLPASAPMYHHAGCGCTQRPITTREA